MRIGLEVESGLSSKGRECFLPHFLRQLASLYRLNDYNKLLTKKSVFLHLIARIRKCCSLGLFGPPRIQNKTFCVICLVLIDRNLDFAVNAETLHLTVIILKGVKYYSPVNISTEESWKLFYGLGGVNYFQTYPSLSCWIELKVLYSLSNHTSNYIISSFSDCSFVNWSGRQCSRQQIVRV